MLEYGKATERFYTANIVRLYAGAVGEGFILMNHNARFHAANVVQERILLVLTSQSDPLTYISLSTCEMSNRSAFQPVCSNQEALRNLGPSLWSSETPIHKR